MNIFRRGLVSLSMLALTSSALYAGEAKAPATEWERTVEAAKKEGKLVAAIPASAELRKAIGEVFPKRYPGIELELTNARGPSNAGKIAAEHAAGVHYYDLLISGTSTPFNLLNAGILEPMDPLLILPEVRDPKRWYGGHIWLDNAKKYIYAFQVYQSENIWHNSTMMKPEEVRSYDDLLLANRLIAAESIPTWQLEWDKTIEAARREAKLVAGVPASAELRKALEENFSKRFAGIEIEISTARGPTNASKIAAEAKEGSYTSSGSGALSVVKNSTHPNAAKVFVNWLLSKEGQEIYGKAMGQATRRLDVDTKWLVEFGTKASKDFLSVEENQRRENSSEEVLTQLWPKAIKLANDLLK